LFLLGRMDHYISDYKGAGFVMAGIFDAGSFDECLDSDHQFPHKKGFGQIVICSTIKTFHLVLQFAECREHKNRGKGIEGSEFPAQIKSRFAWQIDIEDDAVERLLSEYSFRQQSIEYAFHSHFFCFQSLTVVAVEDGVIFYDEDFETRYNGGGGGQFKAQRSKGESSKLKAGMWSVVFSS